MTTPESLYLLLTSESGRRMLATTRSVIVDEIHAVAGNKRGAHLALSLERLAALCPQPPQRIGLSATQKPIEQIARFLVGSAPDVAAEAPGSPALDIGAPPPAPDCLVFDSGHARGRDLALMLPDAPLEAVMSNGCLGNLYDRLGKLFCSTARR